MQHKTAVKIITGFFLFSLLFQAKEIQETSVTHLCPFPTHSITTIHEDSLNNLTNSFYLLLTSSKHNLFSESKDTQLSKKVNESIVNCFFSCTSHKQKYIYLRKVITYSASRHTDLILPKIGVLKI